MEVPWASRCLERYFYRLSLPPNRERHMHSLSSNNTALTRPINRTARTSRHCVTCAHTTHETCPQYWPNGWQILTGWEVLLEVSLKKTTNSVTCVRSTMKFLTNFRLKWLRPSVVTSHGYQFTLWRCICPDVAWSYNNSTTEDLLTSCVYVTSFGSVCTCIRRSHFRSEIVSLTSLHLEKQLWNYRQNDQMGECKTHLLFLEWVISWWYQSVSQSVGGRYVIWWIELAWEIDRFARRLIDGLTVIWFAFLLAWYIYIYILHTRLRIRTVPTK